MESANKMELTYTNVNGYLIPNLTYKSGEQMEQLGKYGLLRRDYLKNHRNATYQVMLLRDTIGEHLLEVDKAAREREEVNQHKLIIHLRLLKIINDTASLNNSSVVSKV